MSDFNEEAGAFLRVDLTDGGWFAIKAHEESVIRKAVVDFRERGIDSLVEVEHRTGYPVAMVASAILYYQPSTPEIRARAVLEELRYEEWQGAFRKAHAVPEWDG